MLRSNRGSLLSHRSLYRNRYNTHIQHARNYFKDGDFIQAGEKLYGALSALINSKAATEKKRPNDKKQYFLKLMQSYHQQNRSFQNTMSGLGFTSDEEIFWSIWGLHVYFYGGKNYPRPWLKTVIPFFINLLDQL